MILVLALLGQLLPVQALAEAGPQMPSSSELAAARALTGLAEDAPIYHAGMSVSSAMNAMQLSGWLDELLGNEMFSLQSAYQSIQTTLERMKAEDPGYYGIMTDTPNNWPYLPRIEKLHHQSEELREELAFYSHRLVEQSYIIDSMMERIGSDEYSDTEKARAARKLDSAAQTIRDIRDAVVQNAAGWETQIGTWMRVLQGDNIMDDQSDALSADWVYLVMAWKPVVAQAQVSTVSLYPKGETLLERLSPVRSALAETKQDVTLRVVSQKNFAISVKEADGPIAGASVTVTQGGVSRTSETGSSGFEQGIAIFNVSDFQMDSSGCIELAMEVTAPGYRGFELRRVQLRKGQVLTYSLKKDDGSPYIYGASFQDNDILLEQYGIYYSPFNDLTRTISATVMSSGGVFCALKYTDASSGKTLYTDAKKATGGKQTVEFTAKWLQTLKPGERVSFLLGSTEESVKNDSAGETPSMLSVQRGAVDKPFFDTTGAFTSAFVPTGTGFLGVTLPQSAPSFIAGSTLSIDFPFVKYWPRLIINVDGSFSFSLGGELKDLSPYDVVGEGEEKVARWKTEDQRSLERRQNDYVEQGEKLRYRAKIGAMWDGAKSKPVSFLGKMNASVSVFMYLYGQYQHDDDGYGRIKGKGGVGMSFSFGAEMTQMTGPFFLNVGLTASVGMGFQIGIEIDTYWPQNGKLTTRATRLSKESGMIILLRLQVDVSLGVGIKGLLSVSVHGYGYVSVLIELLRSSQGLTVSARAGIYLLAEVFLLKWKITIYDMNEEKVLYTTKKNTAAYSPLRILEPFLPSAVAESGEGDQNSTSLIEKSYPKLEIEQAQTVLADISAADTEIQMLTLDGKPFAFYLEKTGTGARVRWVSLSEGKSGDFSAALSEQDGMGGLIDYDFAVSKADYRQLASGQGVSVNEMGFLCVLATPSMRAVPMTLEDGQTLEMQEPTGTIAYFIGFICQNGALTAEIEFAGDGGKVLFGRADVTSGSGQTFINPTVNATSFVKSGISYYFVNLYMERLDKQSAGRQDAGRTLLMFGRPVAVVGGTTFISQLEAIEKLQPVAPQSGANRYQVQTGAAESFGQGVGVGLSSTNYESWYALEGEGESPLTGETRLMHHVMGYSGGKAKGLIELDKGQICYYKAVIGEEEDKTQTDRLFYLMQNPGDETKQYHLKGIRVTHDLYNEKKHYQETGNRYMALSEATLSDYDVIVPASSFDVTTIDGTTYLYWLEAVEPENERDARRYRISGVVYDPNSDRMSDDFVLAEFVPEHSEDEPHRVMLTSEGKGYYVVNRGEGARATSTLYSFPFRYVPSLDLRQITLSDTLVSAGSYNDMVFTITNDGNTAISAFELQLQLLENGVSTTAQTIHADVISPNQSYSQTQQGTISGEKSIYRQEDAVDSLVQSAWTVKRERRTYSTSGNYTKEQKAEYSENGQLLPGMTAAFKTSLWIPADWEGEKHVRLQLSRWSAKANWASGVQAAANGPEEEIVYELRSDGTMVRVQEGTNALMRTQPEGSLYVSTQAADEGVSLNAAIHDIELDYRLYRDAEDVPWVSLVITDEAATAKPIRLYAQVYPDDGEEPMSVALPYFDQAVSVGGTHCIDLPVSALLNGQSCHKARVAVYGIGVEERDDADNEILLVFNENIPPLSFALQPQDRIALEGETIALSVEPTGGVKPYTYQWQVSGRDGKWTDVEGGTADTLSVGPVTRELQGWSYRCQVTDHYLTKACSGEARLTITEAVPTGDESRMEMALAVAVCALLAMLLLRRKARKPE